MAEAVKGRDVVVEMIVDDTFYPILCGTDCEFVRTPEFVEKTSTTSGLFREWAVRREEWAVSVSGLTRIENAAALTFFYMLQSSVRRQEQTIRITFTDVDGADKQISGNILIGQSSISGSVSDFANCSIELKGTGAFTIEDVTAPPVSDFDVFSDYWTTTNGNAFINGASSGSSPSAIANGGAFTLQTTDTILEVRVEGTQFELVTGSPGSREAQPDLSNHKIKFQDSFDGTQRVFVEFKRPV